MDVMQIRTLPPERVIDVVRASVAGKNQPSDLADFLAAVDWSHSNEADTGTVALLGSLEQAVTEFEEGDLDAEALSARLRALLPAPARRRSPAPL